ncbi:hypothetical protein ACF08N_06915 [Streptomyces sp. NPDC015127]|uniref:hypothetical protein n=1 Tax=Streptomyces sp. NPDC015127 TaxID=3364939 RepID=UPI0036FB762E
MQQIPQRSCSMALLVQQSLLRAGENKPGTVPTPLLDRPVHAWPPRRISMTIRSTMLRQFGHAHDARKFFSLLLDFWQNV